MRSTMCEKRTHETVGGSTQGTLRTYMHARLHVPARTHCPCDQQSAVWLLASLCRRDELVDKTNKGGQRAKLHVRDV